MRYFFDTEFIEGAQPQTFLGFKAGMSKPTIDLISIGIVAEDGREYYAISKDFNLNHAWNDEWIRTNVLLPIYTDCVSGDARNSIHFTKSSFRRIVNNIGKHNSEIAYDILKFVYQVDGKEWIGSSDELYNYLMELDPQEKPEFWAYYCNYDWVVFCWVFGKMINKPKGFPMFCMDLKNLMEFKNLSKEWKQEVCPDPIGEHNALVDARWNKKLFETIADLELAF